MFSTLLGKRLTKPLNYVFSFSTLNVTRAVRGGEGALVGAEATFSTLIAQNSHVHDLLQNRDDVTFGES